MSFIVNWISNTLQQQSSEHPSLSHTTLSTQNNKLDDDWCLFEELAESNIDGNHHHGSSNGTHHQANSNGGDQASSIATIEPVRVITQQQHQQLLPTNGLEAALKILNEQSNGGPQPTLAQLKDKELKLRKMNKYRYGRKGIP